MKYLVCVEGEFPKEVTADVVYVEGGCLEFKKKVPVNPPPEDAWEEQFKWVTLLIMAPGTWERVELVQENQEDTEQQ